MISRLLYQGGLVLLLASASSPLAQAQSGSDAIRLGAKPPASPTAARIAVIPVAYPRTSQILLNTYADTPLGAPLSATDADVGGSIVSYTVTVLPPTAAGVLKLNGTTTITTATVITAANAGNLTFDPAPGYFGTAVFQYTAKDNTGANSTAVTYGIPVSKAVCGAGVGQANQLSYFERTEGESWKVTRSVVVDGVTVTVNPAGTPYTFSPTTTDVFFVSDQASLPGKALVWAQDYTSTAATTTAATFTFSRALANFSLSISDLDNGTGYIDQLTLQGYDASGNLVTIPTTNVATSASNSYSNNVFTGTANLGATAAGNIIATFPVPIVRLVMTYRNTATTQADPSSQLIGFPSMAWCAQADIRTTLSGPVRAQAGTTVSYTATTQNVAGDQVSSLTPTVQLPTGLTGVTGGTYNTSTGVLTLPTISSLAAGASVAQVVTYTMPATVAVTATSGFTATAEDPVSANNTSTITTAQNRAPVASNVTNSPAILSSTTSQTNITPLTASDPDASAGNTTITSYTLLSLPTAAQGTLYVNGVAATLNQVITVPTSATSSSPGYQLSFVPNGTFAGTASFTYRATDDANTTSNTATYSIPVTAGADLVSTIAGQATAVEGQSKSYSVTTTNNGPATATNVVPTLTLSSRPAFSLVTVTNGSYDPTTGIVTFNPTASLASGASVANTIVVAVPASPASFTVTAANTSATADPTSANNNGTATTAILSVAVSRIGPAGTASACATPGRDNSPTITTTPNTYYPASNQTVAQGATSLSVGAAVGTTPIAAGDLLLVMQMQGADIDYSNTDAYGDGVPGGLATSYLNNANFTAGQYEYVVAAGPVPVGGGTVTTTTGLKYSYQNASATTTTGQRRFQVVRIPQYQNLTVSGTVAPAAWNGSTGGILALDVTGQLTFAPGARLDASGAGFRGGAGQKLNGATGFTATDYRATAPASGTTTTGTHAMKGEGIVGTPRYVNTGTALLDTGVDGYPAGSAGRGAPGNAGGGGTDSSPANNFENSGGGGGGNGSRGGRGGNSWNSNAAVGGEPGVGFSVPSTNRLILGGGGGAGVTNDGSGGGSAPGYASSGAAGGGIVLVRTGSVSGTGSVLANGASASNAVLNDGSGGGGAGGSILVTANNTTSLSNLILAANGGSGGTNTGSGSPHGPGGGGGGGIVLTNAAPSSASATAGTSGTTAGGVAFGATPGIAGIANSQISSSIAGSSAGIACSTDLTTTISAPTTAAVGQTINLSVLFANNGGVDAASVTQTVTLSSGDRLNPARNVVAPGSASISQPDPATGDVVVTYPAIQQLVAGASNSFGVSYTAPGSTSVTATSAIATASPEPVTVNNTTVATTSITGFADVVSVIYGLTSSTVGRSTAEYAVLYANNGPAAALNVTRTLTLPTGATLTPSQLSAITAQGGTYNSGTQVIDFGSLAQVNSRDGVLFKFSYTASTTAGSTPIITRITTTTAEDANGGTGAATAPNTFPFSVTNNNTSDVATTGITRSAASVLPNQQASFTINFVNNGPGEAVDAQRYAQLTPGLQGVSVTGNGTYDPGTGLVTYAPVTIPNGGTAPSTITFLAPSLGPVDIAATVGTAPGAVSSGALNNNQALASIAVTPIADVATTISGPTSMLTGNLATFAVTTANTGPAAAAAVVQTIQLPANLSGVFASNNGVYDATTGVVTFPAVNVLPTGTVLNNTVSFYTPAANFTATAAVSTATGEAAGTTANNTATAAPTSTVAATTSVANVYTTLVPDEKNVVPGGVLTLTIETGNNGPNAALNVVQQVALPTGLNVTSISNSGTYNPATGVVTFPAISSQASGTSVTNTIRLTAPATGPLVAMASVSAATSDPVSADNLMIRNIDIAEVADVATTLTGSSLSFATQTITYYVNTSNWGPAPARNVVQSVTIPAGFASSAVTTSGGGVYDPATGVITWPTVASLAVGEVRSYTYSFVVPAFKSTDSNAPRTIINQAMVTSSTPDAVAANNAATVATDVKWNSDVAIAVAVPSAAVVGNPITFTVSTSNNGPAPAATVSTAVRLVTGLTNVVASGGGVYDITTGIVTFPTITNQEVGPGGVVTNTITLLAPDRPIIGASAAANTPVSTNDINLANNAATFILPLSPVTVEQVDLQTTIAADRTSQQAGQPVTLTVTATNRSSTATTAQQQVTLPAGLSNVVVTDFNGNPLPGAYNAASGIVVFPQVANMAGNTTLTYQIVVNSPTIDPLVATAAINGNFSDPVAANNTATVSVSVVPVVDVLTRISGPATMLPNGQATYEVITLNNGPSSANAVTQTVQLPTGLSGVVVSGGGSYDVASGLVTFPTITRQVAGPLGEVTNTIRFTFPTTASTIVGFVSSGSNENAGSTANNTASLTTTLANQFPTANTITNRLQAPQGNTAEPLAVSALSGYDLDGSLASFTITAVPAASAGVLSLNGTPVTVNQVINLGEQASLRFDPAAGFIGNAFFRYTTTDNQGATSAPALYTIAVGQDNASVYTTTPVKGGNSNPYQNGDVIANVFDSNGGVYNAATEVTDNGVRTSSVSSSSLPEGMVLDPVSGQVRVADRTLLVPGDYSVGITTVDVNGGITTQLVALRVGASPLPVALAAFEAKAVGQDGQLKWTTAQETNNAGFRVERSVDGTRFETLTFVAGAGSSTQANNYSFVDVGVGASNPGIVYYRLQQVDRSGTSTYSPIRTVRFAPLNAKQVPSVSLYPNPVETKTTLDLSALPSGTYQVTVMDMTGRLLQTTALAGGSAHTLAVEQLRPGTYLVVVQNGSLKFTQRLLKQ